MESNRRIWIAMALTVAVIAIAAGLSVPLPGDDLARWSVQSLRVVDRSGIVLREFPNDRQGRGEWKALAEIAPSMQKATIAVEDRRFLAHPGIDPLAIARSMVDNIRALRFRSGGSTLTQHILVKSFSLSPTLE